jgi:hypothetical protein
MMKKQIVFVMLMSVFAEPLFSQQKIDLAFQYPIGGTFRKYHIYVPTAYNASKPSKLMVGFHAFDKTRWNGKSWRDSLISFAEYKDLLLVCPDGGTDGRIDDQVDYGFTTALIDSMKKWYNIDPLQVFGVGFSVGGKALYEYGLNNSQTFKGFIPMCAAITDQGFVDDVITRAKCKNYYIIHGDQDSPNTRYYPIKEDLLKNKARVNTILMAGVGNIFDFPNRLSIMLRAFNYIDTASCNYTGIAKNEIERIQLVPNPIESGNSVFVFWPGHPDITVRIHDISGAVLSSEKLRNQREHFQLETHSLKAGVYIIEINDGRNSLSERLIIKP